MSARHGRQPGVKVGANRVVSGVWMGSAPPDGMRVRDGGFDVVVLAAAEYQPAASLFPGIEVIHAPLDDARPSKRQIGIALHAANEVVKRRREHKRVLVTCYLGLNRSGLITALALVQLGVRPKTAIACVRAARGDRALHNEHFVSIIENGSVLFVAAAAATKPLVNAFGRPWK